MKSIVVAIQKPLKFISLLAAFIIGQPEVFAQMPQGVPNPNDNSPIDFTSATDIVLYIVLPAVLIIAYLILRNRMIKKRRKDQENSSEN